MKRIVFCGVGALGSNAVVACRSLPVHLVLIDKDRVEAKNCASQAFVRASIGRNKAEAMKLQLSSFWGVKAEAFGVELRANNVEELCHGADLVVDAFDNGPSRRVLSTWARASSSTRVRALLHAGISAEGNFGLVRWDERFVADDAPPDDARSATCVGGEYLPFVTIVAATIARVVEAFVARGARGDAMVAWSGVTSLVHPHTLQERGQ